jgi:lysophospholipase L1-like esterase
MKLFDRRILINTILVASVSLNIALIAYLANSGGLRRIFLKMDLAELPKTRMDFQKEIEARYRKFPNTPAEIVFAGDSIMGDGPWAELFSDVHNRGVGGDTVAGVLGRIDEILESKPRKLFLLIGANDLASAVPDAQYIRHYRALLERIRKDSPETVVNVLAIFPVNMTFPIQPTYDNARVVEANRKLKELVAEFPGVRFLDLTKLLVDDGGSLRREFSTDGMHVNVDGYLAIREALKGPVTEGDGPKPTGDSSKHAGDSPKPTEEAPKP